MLFVNVEEVTVTRDPPVKMAPPREAVARLLRKEDEMMVRLVGAWHNGGGTRGGEGKGVERGVEGENGSACTIMQRR